MTKRRAAGKRPSRRRILSAGFATAAAALAFPDLLAGAEGGKASVQLYDKVEPEKYPWGWIRWLMSDKIDADAEMTMGIVQFEPNQMNTRHMHPNSAEFLHVISGSSEHFVGDRWVTLKEGDTLRIPKGMPHQARTKDQPFRALIVYDTPRRIMVPVTEGEPPKAAKTR
jgi:quercetin dioxygenase-like cupin family protein